MHPTVPPLSPLLQPLIPFAEQLAEAAGAAIRPYFGTDVAVELKADHSPVSLADRAAEAAMRALIQQHYPTHGIFGEEFGSTRTDQRYAWVLDPIDGTRAFLAGGTAWGTLIALCEDDIPILGVLDQPITGERWIGVRGQATRYLQRGEPHPCAPRRCSTLAGATLSTTSQRYFTPPEAARFVRLAEACGNVRENGDCIAYGELARGARDLVVDAHLKPYDILALVPILEGAGALITGWDGAPITLSHYSHVLAAATAELHRHAQALL